MNRLSLAKFVRSKCGISGSETSTDNATGEWSDVVSAVDEAYEQVQLEREDWLFLRKPFSFIAVTGQGEYAPSSAPLSLADFSSFVPDEFRIYKDSINNETFLVHWKDYDAFRNAYLLGAMRTQYSSPTDIVISPSKSLILALAPNDATYTVSGFYWRTPAVMTTDTDEPIFPVRFHKIIAYKAIHMLGINEAAAELIDWGHERYAELLGQLERDQLPVMTFNHSFL